jgi:hypothetical protein
MTSWRVHGKPYFTGKMAFRLTVINDTLSIMEEKTNGLSLYTHILRVEK